MSRHAGMPSARDLARDMMSEQARQHCEASGHSWTEDMRHCWRCLTKPTEEEFNAAEAIREAESAERRQRWEAAKRELAAIESLERCWERNR